MRREVMILVAKSEAMSELLHDIVGQDSGRAFGLRIGVSAGYGVAILAGSVPSDDVLAAIVDAYGLDDILTKRLFDTARETRPDIDPVNLLQTACAAAGLTTSGRMAVLESFRDAISRQHTQNAA